MRTNRGNQCIFLCERRRIVGVIGKTTWHCTCIPTLLISCNLGRHVRLVNRRSNVIFGRPNFNGWPNNISWFNIRILFICSMVFNSQNAKCPSGRPEWKEWDFEWIRLRRRSQNGDEGNLVVCGTCRTLEGKLPMYNSRCSFTVNLHLIR
jgi:hypothetical protein